MYLFTDKGLTDGLQAKKFLQNSTHAKIDDLLLFSLVCLPPLISHSHRMMRGVRWKIASSFMASRLQYVSLLLSSIIVQSRRCLLCEASRCEYLRLEGWLLCYQKFILWIVIQVAFCLCSAISICQQHFTHPTSAFVERNSKWTFITY